MSAGRTYALRIASVGGSIFDGHAASATFPGSSGEITVLPNHEPIVTTLRQGVIIVRLAEGETRQFPIDGGVLECSGGRAIALL